MRLPEQWRARWHRYRFGESYVRAAHYFGDGWPVNCWSDTRLDSVAGDFQRLREDGFNAVILVVPWRGFQIEQFPPRYEEHYWKLLRSLMKEASRAGLMVILRVSYAHHICEGAQLSSQQLTEALLTDERYLEPWRQYLARLGRLVSWSPALLGGFLCWEEFWHVLMSFTERDEAERARLAHLTGYADFTGATEELIPTSSEPAFRSYHAFINARIRRLYDRARLELPWLGLEVRVDKDPVPDEQGNIEWLSNDRGLDLETLRYSYWAPFIGAENRGEHLNAEQALQLLDYSLREQTTDGANCAQLIDQFNFIDDTFKYSGQHASIAETALPEFLQRAIPLLQQYSRGLGIWAWRDYIQNALFNPGFALGLEGWTVVCPGVMLERSSVCMDSGAELGQSFWGMSHGLHRRYRSESLQLEVVGEADSGVVLESCLDGDNYVVLERRAAGSWGAELPVDDPVYGKRGALFRLRVSSGTLRLRRIHLSQHTYRVGFRDHHGREGPRLALLRQLNAGLAEQAPVL